MRKLNDENVAVGQRLKDKYKVIKMMMMMTYLSAFLTTFFHVNVSDSNSIESKSYSTVGALIFGY